MNTDRATTPDGEFVVKPSVSAGSRNTARYTSSDMAQLETTPNTSSRWVAPRWFSHTSGTPLLELELVEPSMFLAYAPPQAVSTFATAIMAEASKPNAIAAGHRAQGLRTTPG